MSAFSPNSAYAKRLDAVLRVDNLNRTVENGYRWYVNEQTYAIEKREISSNKVIQILGVQSANTPDTQNPVFWLLLILGVFLLFKLTSNQ
jgi:hypothetical protein